MGGKRLKFPKRGKYVDPDKVVEFKEEEQEKKISEEEHEKRMKMLRDLGLVK